MRHSAGRSECACVGGHLSEMQLWIHDRPNRQRNSDVQWALGCHWAIEPHCRGRGGYYLARFPYEQPTRGHLLCLVFDGHSTGGFVLFGAVTSACIESERYSRPVARCAESLRSFVRLRQLGTERMASDVEVFFFALWRWRRWRLSRNQLRKTTVP